MNSPNHPDGHFYEVRPSPIAPHFELFRDGEYFFTLSAGEIRDRGLSHLLPEAHPVKSPAIQVIWQSQAYAPELVKSRFLKCSCTLDSFVWHECAEGGETLREGLADWREIPGTIMAKAKACAGTRFGYVDWPL